MRFALTLILVAGVLLALSFHTAAFFYDIEKVTAEIYANWHTQADDLKVTEVNFCEKIEELKDDFKVLKLENVGSNEITVWKINANSSFIGVLSIGDDTVDVQWYCDEEGEFIVDFSHLPLRSIFRRIKTRMSG